MIKITEKEFVQLSNYIREHYGINLKKEKNAGDRKTTRCFIRKQF